MSDLDTPGLRILIVENHPDTREYLQMHLDDLGHVTKIASTMEEALSALNGEVFDLLISDIGLPDGDGWEILRRAGERKPRYCIAMSGFGANSEHLKSKAVGYGFSFNTSLNAPTNSGKSMKPS